MKHLSTSLTVASLALTLSACTGGQGSPQDSLRTRNQNPLFAERYAEEMVHMLTELEIQEDPIIEDPAMKTRIDTLRQEWLQEANDARSKQRGGTSAQFIAMQEFTQGEALYLENMLYLSSNFETMPGPDLRLYLTTAVDPRDDVFPDASAIDLGAIDSPYGAQHYAVPEVENPLAYRTAVLWDATLGRLYGFAQLGL